MTKTKQSASMTEGDSVIGTRVVRKRNDGLWLNFNVQRHGGVKGGSLQYVRGVTSRRTMQTGRIGTWDIGGFRCEVHRLAKDRSKASGDRFDIAVMNPWGVRPFLLSAQGELHRGFGYGGLNVHVHAPLIERLGGTEAVVNARKWANSLGLCLPTLHDVALCERVSRIDFAVDVLVEKEGPDDYGRAVHEQLISRLKHPKPFWGTGWEIGLGNTKKDRMKRVIVSYDKFKERWDKGGFAGLLEYVESLNEPGLVVHRDGRVIDVDDNEMRCWRVEFRFHRSFLNDKGIDDADEAIAALPALIANACQTTRLHQRCTTGNVFPTNPVTRLWNFVNYTVT